MISCVKHYCIIYPEYESTYEVFRTQIQASILCCCWRAKQRYTFSDLLTNTAYVCRARERIEGHTFSNSAFLALVYIPADSSQYTRILLLLSLSPTFCSVPYTKVYECVQCGRLLRIFVNTSVIGTSGELRLHVYNTPFLCTQLSNNGKENIVLSSQNESCIYLALTQQLIQQTTSSMRRTLILDPLSPSLRAYLGLVSGSVCSSLWYLLIYMTLQL